MKKLKLLFKFIELKIKGYDKGDRYFYYAIHDLITFEQYEKFIDNKIMKGGENK